MWYTGKTKAEALFLSSSAGQSSNLASHFSQQSGEAPLLNQEVNRLKIHEHQALTLLDEAGVPNAGGQVAFTPEEASAAARALGGDRFVVKAQIHAGGRGKAGGVRLVEGEAGVREAAQALLGATLVTPQTGPNGKVVHRLLVAPALSIVREYYLSLLLDSENACLVFMASTEGGTEIEEVAKQTPEKILRQAVDPIIGLRDFQISNLAAGLDLKGEARKDFFAVARGLYRLFLEKDCSLIELNPLVLTADGRLLALDVKINFDDNALMRHKELAALRDELEEDPREVEAAKNKLSYIPLDGTIGCMVNGAGLAMATMDIIKAFGGEPANFLDVGGGASAEKVAAAFSILLADKKVRGILVNIFGGIMRCDVLAEGILEAAKAVSLEVPLVVRMKGTNAEKGAEILRASGLPIHYEPDLGRAVHTIVSLTKEGA